MIYGPRIRFRRPERSDLPMFVRWLNDPEVRRGISMILPFSLDEEEKWYEGLLLRPPDERLFTIEIPDGEDWRAIGNTGFFDFDRRNRSVEFGIMIGEKGFWNQGYGTEATELILRIAFDTLNLHRVMLRVFANNPRAIRAYEKAGFKHEGILREAYFMDGAYIDVHLMGVLRPDWQAARQDKDA